MSTVTLEKKGINLLDILPLMKKNSIKQDKKATLVKEYLDTIQRIKDFEVSLAVNLDKSLIKTTLGFAVNDKVNGAEPLIERLKNIRLEILSTYGSIPKEVEEYKLYNFAENNSFFRKDTQTWDSKYNLSVLNMAPIISGKDVKDIVDKFGFVAMPASCLHEDAYNLAEWPKRKQIDRFKSFKDSFEVYVIAPLEYYSLENHVRKNTDESPVYSGVHEQTFNAITITLPMFRTMDTQITTLTKDSQMMATNLRVIQTGLNQMRTSINRLQEQFDKQQKAQMLQALKLEEQKRELEAMERSRIRSMDPLMIAFKKGTDINSEEFNELPCFVGPCWGPDFSELVATALDLKVIKNQRSLLTKTATELWN